MIQPVCDQVQCCCVTHDHYQMFLWIGSTNLAYFDHSVSKHVWRKRLVNDGRGWDRAGRIYHFSVIKPMESLKEEEDKYQHRKISTHSIGDFMSLISFIAYTYQLQYDFKRWHVTLHVLHIQQTMSSVSRCKLLTFDWCLV